MPKLNTFTDHLNQSHIRSVTTLINKSGGINLGQGICDLPTPEPIREGAKRAIDEGKSIYSHYSGIKPAKELLFKKFTETNNIALESPDQIMISGGSTGCFVSIAMTLFKPGDHIILFEPYYGYHVNLMKIFGLEMSYVPITGKDRSVDFDDLKSKVKDNTKAILITTPANPCGKVWTQNELDKISDIINEHDLWCITDEVYEFMIFDGRKHVSLASIPSALDRTITINSFSKTYNMTGWRLGAACGPKEVIDRAGLVNDLVYICAPTPLQHGLVEGLKLPESYYTEMNDEYAIKRDIICDTLEELGFEVPRPQGAYYVFAGFEGISGKFKGFSDDLEAATTLIEKAGVATVPGRAFYDNHEDGKYFLRICFAKEIPILKQACAQLKVFFAQN